MYGHRVVTWATHFSQNGKLSNVGWFNEIK